MLITVYPPCDCSQIAVFLLSSNLRKRNKLCREFLSVATVEYKSPLCISAVIYLQCMKLCLAKGIIIPFAYNSSESGSGHTSHRNLIRLIIVFVVVCVHIYSQLHCFSLVRSTPLCILAVTIYLQCMKLCLAKGIPFAYNSSESGFGHISHRNLTSTDS